NRSINKWFSVPVDLIFTATADMSAEWRRDHEALARSVLIHIEQEPQADLEKIRRTFRLKAFVVVGDDGRILRSSADADFQAADVSKQFVPALGSQNEAFIEMQQYLVAVRRATAGHEVFASVFPRSARIAELTAKIADERQNYAELYQNQIFYRDFYV